MVGERVFSFAAVEGVDVCAIAAVEDVVSCSTFQSVDSASAVEVVVACAASEDIVLVVASDRVVARAAGDIFDGDELVACVVGCRSVGEPAVLACLCEVDGDGVFVV